MFLDLRIADWVAPINDPDTVFGQYAKAELRIKLQGHWGRLPIENFVRVRRRQKNIATSSAAR
jgi:hypothetical protein